MKQNRIKTLIIFVGIFFIAVGAIAQTPMEPMAQPSQTMFIPNAPDVNATSYVLMDANSGKILAQKNMNQRHPPASLTKLMTLYLISEALHNGAIKINDSVRISKKAWRTGGSKCSSELARWFLLKN